MFADNERVSIKSNHFCNGTTGKVKQVYNDAYGNFRCEVELDPPFCGTAKFAVEELALLTSNEPPSTHTSLRTVLLVLSLVMGFGAALSLSVVIAQYRIFFLIFLAIFAIVALLLPQEIRSAQNVSTCQKSAAVVTKPVSEFSKFIFDLAGCDKHCDFVPLFMQIINTGEKYNHTKLVYKFIDYYGQLTIKFLSVREDLLKLNAVVDTTQSISTALVSLEEICNNFITKMLENDILDIEADIAVLGVVSQSDNLIEGDMQI